LAVYIIFSKNAEITTNAHVV